MPVLSKIFESDEDDWGDEVEHLHVDVVSNSVRVLMSSGKVVEYEKEGGEAWHVFSNCHTAIGDLPIEEQAPVLQVLAKPFAMASNHRPRLEPSYNTRRILSLRVIRGDALTGLYISWKLLLAVSCFNPELAYPPIISDRMVADMSCHLFASMSWHSDVYSGYQRHMIAHHLYCCVEFARYLLTCVNIHGMKDWHLMFLTYKPKDASDTRYYWYRVDNNTPEERWPLSSEHTSQVDHDDAYDKLGLVIPGY
jgi:hypothetical protein